MMLSSERIFIVLARFPLNYCPISIMDNIIVIIIIVCNILVVLFLDPEWHKIIRVVTYINFD